MSHRTFVAPIATGMSGVMAYLVQDYVAAESLDITVRQGPMAAGDALRVAAQLAGALDLAADAGVDHGVLHPRDVLLSGDETRLTGLGIARALERVGVPTPVRRPYTAPERNVGSPWDRRADVFGLAALLHEMLWGRRVSAMGDEAAASLTEIPGGDLARLRDVFGRALATDPATRFDTALELVGALNGAFQSAVGSQQSAVASAPTAVDQARFQSETRDASEPRLPLDAAAEADAAWLLSEPELPAESVEETAEPFVEEIAEPVVVRGDFNLREREALRFADVDVESDPAGAYSAAPPVVPPVGVDSYRPAPPVEAVDSAASPSSISPLAFALVIGGALGFAFGFGIGTRGRSEAPSEASMAPVTAPASSDGVAAATTGSPREFTEGTVAGTAADANRPVRPPPAQPAAAPPARVTPRAAAAAPIVGSLLVRSTPPGARVFVDGREYGQTPVTVDNLARGGHRVRVTRDGYATDERQVTITPAQRAHSITVRLSPERPAPAASAPPPARAAAGAARSTGRLTVESRPSGAQVFIDGRLVGTTPLALDAVPVGEHALHLDHEGYRRWSAAIRVAPSTPNRVAASLDR